MRRLACALVLMFLPAFVQPSFGQVNPGTPSWSAYDSHEIDTINLQNLNIVLSVPV